MTALHAHGRLRQSRRARASAWGFHGSGVALGILFLAPLLWAVFKSFTGGNATADGNGVGFGNYVHVATYGSGLLRYLLNSAIVVVITVVGSIVLSVLAGYAFARFQFPGKNILFLAVLLILMVPHPTVLVPLYSLASWAHMQDSLVTVGLVLIVFQLPFSIFMMRNAFESVPIELEEAALLDGCSHFGALRRILVRAVTPAIVTVGMFAFLASWNEFLTPLIFLNDGSSFTLPVALVSMRTGEMGTTDFGALEAGVVVSAIPCLIIFVLLQRHYVRGFTAGAVR